MKTKNLINKQVSLSAQYELVKWCLQKNLDTDLLKNFVDTNCKNMLRHNFDKPYPISYLSFDSSAIELKEITWLDELEGALRLKTGVILIFSNYDSYLEAVRLWDKKIGLDTRSLIFRCPAPVFRYSPKHRGYGYVSSFKI